MKVLFVCTANLQRSSTVETLFQAWNGTWEAKSAGMTPDPDGNPLTQELIDWADIIVVMERIHSQYIHANFRRDMSKVHVLNIADKYFRDDPELIRELLKKVPSILDEY
jgi:predicted protein tyrosine phosphatase